MPNKQQEIRKGLMGILAISNISVEAKLKFVLGFLHENNVVIKVDKELPIDTSQVELRRLMHIKIDALEAGYVATESIIEE